MTSCLDEEKKLSAAPSLPKSSSSDLRKSTHSPPFPPSTTLSARQSPRNFEEAKSRCRRTLYYVTSESEEEEHACTKKQKIRESEDCFET
eukprot:270280-Rhodomonas_salina.1